MGNELNENKINVHYYVYKYFLADFDQQILRFGVIHQRRPVKGGDGCELTWTTVDGGGGGSDMNRTSTCEGEGYETLYTKKL